MRAKTQQPKSQQPKSPEPTAKEPTAKEPKANSQRANSQQPKSPKPTAKEPTAKEPKSQQPKSPKPTAKEPTAKEPKSQRHRMEMKELELLRRGADIALSIYGGIDEKKYKMGNEYYTLIARVGRKHFFRDTTLEQRRRIVHLCGIKDIFSRKLHLVFDGEYYDDPRLVMRNLWAVQGERLHYVQMLGARESDVVRVVKRAVKADTKALVRRLTRKENALVLQFEALPLMVAWTTTSEQFMHRFFVQGLRDKKAVIYPYLDYPTAANGNELFSEMMEWLDVKVLVDKAADAAFKEEEERRLAVAMAMHHRLGGLCGLGKLPDSLMPALFLVR